MYYFYELRKKRMINRVQKWLREDVIRDATTDAMLNSILNTLIEPYMSGVMVSRGACWFISNPLQRCGKCTVKNFLKGYDGDRTCQIEHFTKFNPKTCPHIKKAKAWK